MGKSTITNDSKKIFGIKKKGGAYKHRGPKDKPISKYNGQGR